MRSRLLSMFVVLSLVGCSQPGEEVPRVDGGEPVVDAGLPPVDAGQVDAGAPDSGAPDAGPLVDPSTFTLTFPTELISVGDDRTRCVVLDLGNNFPAKVGSFHLQTTGPTFSFELYATDEAVSETPRDCHALRAMTEAGHKTVLVSYSHDETVTMHADVAYSFAAHQHFLLVLHSWNPAAEADSAATVTMTTSPTATHEAAHVTLMNIDAAVTAKQSALMVAYFPGINGIAEQAKFFSIAGYGQRFSTQFQIYETDDQQFPVRFILDQTPYDFANSPRWTGTPFSLPLFNKFHLQCTWNNPLAVDVSAGAGVDDLLCGLGGYYYGAAGVPQLCAFTSNPTPAAICCPGDAKCGTLF